MEQQQEKQNKKKLLDAGTATRTLEQKKIEKKIRKRFFFLKKVMRIVGWANCTDWTTTVWPGIYTMASVGCSQFIFPISFCLVSRDLLPPVICIVFFFFLVGGEETYTLSCRKRHQIFFIALFLFLLVEKQSFPKLSFSNKKVPGQSVLSSFSFFFYFFLLLKLLFPFIIISFFKFSCFVIWIVSYGLRISFFCLSVSLSISLSL